MYGTGFHSTKRSAKIHYCIAYGPHLFGRTCFRLYLRIPDLRNHSFGSKPFGRGSDSFGCNSFGTQSIQKKTKRTCFRLKKCSRCRVNHFDSATGAFFIDQSSNMPCSAILSSIVFQSSSRPSLVLTEIGITKSPWSISRVSLMALR